MAHGGLTSDVEARLAVADAQLAGADYWVVCRPVLDAGTLVDVEYVFANAAAERALGLGPLGGRRMFELVPEVRDTLLPMFRAVVESGEPQHATTRDVVRDRRPDSVGDGDRDDGPAEPGWTTVDVRAWRELVVVHWQDATAEQTHALATARSDARLQALLANAGEVIVVFAPDGRTVLYQSPSIERVLGRTASQDGISSRVHPDDRPAVDRAFAEIADRGLGARAELELRLEHTDGRWLWIHVRGENHVDEPDVGGIVLNIWDVTAQHELADQLRRQALQDPLTGLPNRRLIDAELERALGRTERTPGRVGLLLCDVDYFKGVNDALGHPAGDQLLVQVAERLRAVVRPADTVGRLGGDEFVVIAEDLRSPHELSALTRRLQGALRGMYRVGGHDLPVTVTLGASCSTGDATPSSLLSEADTALYEAKRAGRDRSQLFDRRAHGRSRDRVVRQAALSTAVDDGQLVLHYQPKVDLRSGTPVAAEALVRWQHPTQGLLMPGAFLPLAEEGALVVDLGRWVLEAAMRAAAAWTWSGTPGTELPAPAVDINVSGRHLTHPSMLEHLDRALRTSGIDPARVELELTETVLLQDLEMAGRILAGVRDRGVRIALDDFGTGYSSLTWLQRLPVDTVKLDRSFIADLLSDSGGFGPDILGSVTSLAHALGKNVIAEGVETRAQHEYLVGLGCDQAQGYYYGRPAPETPFPAAREAAGGAADGATTT
ncbi:putative bifunctional diguanylate cyclase/phosphodiesterase [Cellulomonas aerilata]|uniref:putative bifunctional diguanylate cyclase/phosphodiesterase n=1 Tax=Cellulomonas aerilata TaxID=515326 RepID=UPI0011BDB308|nr:GGDEF and EAL domain-containing protein [Cellulomonas aerilata]